MLSDKSKIELLRCYKTHHVKTHNTHTLKNTIPILKLGGVGLLFSNGTGKLHIIEVRINGQIYREILDKNLLPSTRMMKMKRGWTFQIPNTQPRKLSIGFKERK